MLHIIITWLQIVTKGTSKCQVRFECCICTGCEYSTNTEWTNVKEIKEIRPHRWLVCSSLEYGRLWVQACIRENQTLHTLLSMLY